MNLHRGRQYDYDKGCLTRLLFTAIYTLTWLPLQRNFCIAKVPVPIVCRWFSVPLLLPRTGVTENWPTHHITYFTEYQESASLHSLVYKIPVYVQHSHIIPVFPVAGHPDSHTVFVEQRNNVELSCKFCLVLKFSPSAIMRVVLYHNLLG